MNTPDERQPSNRAVRIIFGLLGGSCAAAVLECVNGVCTFLVPPLIVLTPLCLLGGVVLALTVGRRERPEMWP